MADNADIAGEYIESSLENTLANRPNPPVGPGAPDCLDCGDPVPAGRRKLGHSLCVECAWRQERVGMGRL